LRRARARTRGCGKKMPPHATVATFVSLRRIASGMAAFWCANPPTNKRVRNVALQQPAEDRMPINRPSITQGGVRRPSRCDSSTGRGAMRQTLPKVGQRIRQAAGISDHLFSLASPLGQPVVHDGQGRAAPAVLAAVAPAAVAPAAAALAAGELEGQWHNNDLGREKATDEMPQPPIAGHALPPGASNPPVQQAPASPAAAKAATGGERAAHAARPDHQSTCFAHARAGEESVLPRPAPPCRRAPH
jgi:hypothetical protein